MTAKQPAAEMLSDMTDEIVAETSAELHANPRANRGARHPGRDGAHARRFEVTSRLRRSRRASLRRERAVVRELGLRARSIRDSRASPANQPQIPRRQAQSPHRARPCSAAAGSRRASRPTPPSTHGRAPRRAPGCRRSRRRDPHRRARAPRSVSPRLHRRARGARLARRRAPRRRLRAARRAPSAQARRAAAASRVGRTRSRPGSWARSTSSTSSASARCVVSLPPTTEYKPRAARWRRIKWRRVIEPSAPRR